MYDCPNRGIELSQRFDPDAEDFTCPVVIETEPNVNAGDVFICTGILGEVQLLDAEDAPVQLFYNELGILHKIINYDDVYQFDGKSYVPDWVDMYTNQNLTHISHLEYIPRDVIVWVSPEFQDRVPKGSFRLSC